MPLWTMSLLMPATQRTYRLSRQILFVTDGGSGLLKALRTRFGKKLVHPMRDAYEPESAHLAKSYRN